MALFDRYIAVDWSASNRPTRGKDSIWIADSHAPTLNVPTRHAAMTHLRAAIGQAMAHNQRILIGFDFPFGYPRGTAIALAGQKRWDALWAMLADLVEDDQHNRSNRFEVAAALNRRLPVDSRLFWGHPQNRTWEGLTPTKPRPATPTLPERRLVETIARGAKTVWQLAYAGSVGSQALLGIAHLQALRTDPFFSPHVAVWPFETAFAMALARPVVLAEIYPSGHTLAPDPTSPRVKDQLQVEAVVRDFRAWDGEGTLAVRLTPSLSLTPVEAETVLTEEGWIAGQ